MQRIFAAALLGLALVEPCAAGPGTAAVRVQTTAGAVQGRIAADATARMWLGVPYAEPPVGPLRWRAPRPPVRWSGVRNADEFGNPCAQIGSIYGPPPAGKPWGLANVEAIGKPVGSEDCLTLNIWRPNSNAVGLPVVVFIHGGSGIAGYSGDPMYEGTRLAATANAVVVTINMRLGIFASFLHPALASGDALDNSGNFGKLDTIAALRFVRDNAAVFGGDASNVTLMGQSAGAIAVYGMMVSPLASGLFHKAIVMSGLMGDGTPTKKGIAFSDDFLQRLLVGSGVARSQEAAADLVAEKGSAWSKQYLLSKKADEILLQLQRDQLTRKVPGGFTDGVVLPTDLKGAFAQGRFHRVPTLVGTTRDEAKLMAGVFKVSDAQRFTMMLTTNPNAPLVAQPHDLIKGYLLPSFTLWPYDTYTSAITALLMRGVRTSIETLRSHQDHVFVYRFDWNRGPEPWRTVYGAAHAIDLPFVFGNFSNNFFAMEFSERNRPGREALSQLMMQSIAAFIRTGDPNNPGLPVTWIPWNGDGAAGKQLMFDASDENASLSVQ